MTIYFAYKQTLYVQKLKKQKKKRHKINTQNLQKLYKNILKKLNANAIMRM